MSIPGTLGEVFVVVAVVLPGLVFGTVRSWLRGFGPEDMSAANRVAQAIVVGILFDLVYLALIGPWLVGLSVDTGRRDPRALARWIALFGVVIPSVLAYFMFGHPFKRPILFGKRLPIPVPNTPYRSAPTAWDRKLPHLGGRFVRVELPNGNIVGGWYGGESYVSTYPQPRDIYLEHQYAVKEKGVLEEMTDMTAGVWVSVPEGSIVIFTDPPSEDRRDGEAGAD